jgi:hypothetical protein
VQFEDEICAKSRIGYVRSRTQGRVLQARSYPSAMDVSLQEATCASTQTPAAFGYSLESDERIESVLTVVGL